MKAIILNDNAADGDFSLADLPTPEPAAGEVLVRIAACAFNPIDYQMREGRSERKLLASPVLGRECAGVVERCGGVTDFAPGDRVHAYVGSLGSNGTYAEYVSLPASLLAKVPDGLSLEQAAALPMGGLTALQCADRLRIFAPRAVFVAGGAGGVGYLLIQLLALHGVRIVATAGNPASRDLLAALGLLGDAIVDYRAPDVRERALAANGGQRYDAAVDIVGGAMSETCADLLAPHGVLADIANLGADAARERLFNLGATVLNVANYARALDRDPQLYRQYGLELARIAAKVADGRIKPPPVELLDGLTVENVEKAHEILARNGAAGRKLVMRVAAC